jgi:hypothetical protein
MLELSRRFRVLIVIAIGMAVLLAAGLVWRLASAGDDRPGASDGEFARIEKHRRAGNVAALAETASHADATVARRAVEALGRIGAGALPQIRRALRDARPRVREKAATVCGQVGSHKEAPALAAMVRQDRSPDVRAAAVSALDRLRAFDEMETIIAAMRDPDLAVRRRASVAASRIACTNVRYKPDDPPELREAAIRRMQAVWAAEQDRARRFWTIILDRRKKP